jgi:hypothetical protein
MQTLQKIVQLLEDMRPTMARAKIDDKFLIFANCDKLPGYCLEDALNWLMELHAGAFKECQKIRRMQSEEMWAKYELWDDFEDCNEVKLYNAKLDAFKNHCRNRPLIFRHSACEQAIAENERAKPRKKKAKKNED